MDLLKIFFKIISVIILTIFLVITILGIGWAYYNGNLYTIKIFMSKEEKSFHKKLKEFTKSNKESILLAELTNFEWDETCYIGPYSGIDSERSKRFKLNKSLPNSNNEGIASIIFFNNKTSTGKVFVLERINPENELIEENFEKESCKTPETAKIFH